MSAPTSDQRVGCLLGLALGDALGFVVEAQPPAVAKEYVAELRAGRAGERSHPCFPFGQYSDDTQFAREFLLSVRDAGGFDPAAFGSRLAVLFASGRDIGAGPGSRAAARLLADGVPWTESGTRAPYAGNGSAMRAAPIGLLVPPNSVALVRVAVEQSRVTHQDPRCAAGAVAMAGAAALAARGGAVSPGAWVTELDALVRPIDERVAEAIGLAGAWARLPAESAAAALRAAGLDPASSAEWQGISAHVVPSLVWALYAFLSSPDSYLGAVCTAIQVGGDTDSMAAMTGALAGARLGRAALPGGLVSRVNDRGEWDAEALAALAEVCLAGY